MPASSDPVKRARQLANISRTSATKHGAHSAELVTPLADAHLDRLAKLLPTADRELLAIQARRAAQMELLQDWIARNGLLRRSPKGSIYGAAEFHERLAAQFERTHLAMLEREQTHGSPGETLESIAAELNAGDDVG